MAPDGFEERPTDAGVELAAYVDADRARRFVELFPAASVVSVPAGWDERWKAFHRPVVAGGVWIGPPWETPPAGRPAVVIDPGLAFGTGAHPTTRLCLDLLAGIERGSLLDVGCGSGVIALAGRHLGFAPVVAVDVDPVAVQVAADNAAANGVSVDVLCRDALSDGLPPVEVAVVNVLLDPVTEILRRLDARSVVTSGYLAGERPLHDGWEHVRAAERDGWAADVFRRPSV